MEKRPWSGTVWMVIILAGVMVVSVNAVAQTKIQMTPLERKLYEAAKAEGKLVYWDSPSLKEATLLFKAFNDRYPGIEISYYETTEDESDQRYFAERQAGRKPVDVLAIAWYSKFKEDGCLTDLTDIIKDTRFPVNLCAKDLDCVGIEHTVKGAAYNTKLVPPKDVPRSWEDLLDPKWKGKIAIDPVLDIFIYLTPSWGEEKMIAYLKKLREQNLVFSAGVTHTMTLLGAGEFPIAVDMNLARTLDLQSRGAPVAFVPLSVVVDKFAPVVVLRDAPHPNAGKLYLRWLMSAEGQSMVDKIRRKGNPLPGSGTLQSKAIEQLGINVLVVPHWEVDFKPLQEAYRKTLGFTKETKVLEQKK